MDSSEDAGAGLVISFSREILEMIASGQGPQRYLVALGYAGWGPGQLEDELAYSDWLTAPSCLDVIFDLPFEERLGPRSRPTWASTCACSAPMPATPDLRRTAAQSSIVTALVFDFGLKHIGVAMAEPRARLAPPADHAGRSRRRAQLASVVGHRRNMAAVYAGGGRSAQHGRHGKRDVRFGAMLSALVWRDATGCPWSTPTNDCPPSRPWPEARMRRPHMPRAAEVIAETWLNSCTEPLPTSRS